jgi:hypothetical protein
VANLNTELIQMKNQIMWLEARLMSSDHPQVLPNTVNLESFGKSIVLTDPNFFAKAYDFDVTPKKPEKK